MRNAVPRIWTSGTNQCLFNSQALNAGETFLFSKVSKYIWHFREVYDFSKCPLFWSNMKHSRLKIMTRETGNLTAGYAKWMVSVRKTFISYNDLSAISWTFMSVRHNFTVCSPQLVYFVFKWSSPLMPSFVYRVLFSFSFFPLCVLALFHAILVWGKILYSQRHLFFIL